MNELITEFIEYLIRTKNYSAHTADAYESDIRDFVDFLVKFNGAAISVDDVARADTLMFRSYLADRQKRGLSHKSTARALSSLRGLYKYLGRRYGIKNDAIGLISSPKVPRKLSKAIDPIDVEHMHDAITETTIKNPWIAARDWALVLVLFGCGLRISEALSLRNQDIVGYPDVLRIVGKGDKERLVPVLPVVWEAVKKYVSVRPFASEPGDALFRSVRGLPMSARMAEKVDALLLLLIQLKR